MTRGPSLPGRHADKRGQRPAGATCSVLAQPTADASTMTASPTLHARTAARTCSRSSSGPCSHMMCSSSAFRRATSASMWSTTLCSAVLSLGSASWCRWYRSMWSGMGTWAGSAPKVTKTDCCSEHDTLLSDAPDAACQPTTVGCVVASGAASFWAATHQEIVCCPTVNYWQLKVGHGHVHNLQNAFTQGGSPTGRRGSRAPHLPVGEALQEVGLAAAVGANQPVAPPDGELNRAILEESKEGRELSHRFQPGTDSDRSYRRIQHSKAIP